MTVGHKHTSAVHLGRSAAFAKDLFFVSAIHLYHKANVLDSVNGSFRQINPVPICSACTGSKNHQAIHSIGLRENLNRKPRFLPLNYGPLDPPGPQKWNLHFGKADVPQNSI